MSIESAKTDLAYIRQLMEDTRKATRLGGGYFIVWGLATGLGLFMTWLTATHYWTISPFVYWAGCMMLGSLGTYLLVRREQREPVEPAAGKLIGMVWMSMGITMSIIFFVGVGTGALDPQHLSALACALLGGSVFITGFLSGQKWLRNLAFGWWAGSVVMFVWPGIHVLLLMGLLLVALYVIPGVILLNSDAAKRG